MIEKIKIYRQRFRAHLSYIHLQYDQAILHPSRTKLIRYLKQKANHISRTLLSRIHYGIVIILTSMILWV